MRFWAVIRDALAASPWPHLQLAEATHTWNDDQHALEVWCWVPTLVENPQPKAPSCHELRDYLAEAVSGDVDIKVRLLWPAPRYYPGDLLITTSF